MIKLETIEGLQAFLAENPDSIILKHSTSCPISARALREFNSFATNSPVPLAIVLVIEARPVSLRLAELANVPHQSPQALSYRNGQFYHNLSHYQITVEKLSAILEDKS